MRPETGIERHGLWPEPSQSPLVLSFWWAVVVVVVVTEGVREVVVVVLLLVLVAPIGRRAMSLV